MASDQTTLGQALGLMRNALNLLDHAGGATEVGAHLDLAIHRLADLLPNLQTAGGQDLSPWSESEQRRG
jgi:hypothetical protein